MESHTSILDRFRKKYFELFALKPDVQILEKFENNIQASSKIIITVKHELIFDNRLVPKSFEGIEIENVTIGKFPKEFPDANTSMPWFKIFSPDNYRRFVSNNIDVFRDKLNNRNLSIEEALDAITEGFRNYEKKCIEARRMAIEKSKEEIAFFNALLEETEKVFLKSDIYNQYGKEKEWWYSVLATSILKDTPMIVGFNWGAAKDCKYEKQKEYPIRMFESNFNELGSLKRTINYFYKYYPDALTGMQTNYCFFRSEKESQISASDLKLCRDLFCQLINYAQPSSIVSFSSKLRDYLLYNQLITDVQQNEVDFRGKKYSSVKAKMKLSDNSEISFFYLPHPSTKIGTAERDRLWEYCFNNN